MGIKDSSKRRDTITFIVKWFLLFLIVAVGLGFGLAQPLFFKSANLLEVLRSSVNLSIMAAGLCFVFSVGEIDFAAGAEMSLAAVVIGKIMDIPAFENLYVVAVILTLIIMALVGFINSILVVRVRIPAFIATLGMSTMLSGICKYFTKGGSFISQNWPKAFTEIGQRYSFGVIPNPVWVLIGGALLAYFVLDKTRFGRYIYAVGQNPTASAHVGINVNKMKTWGFMCCSMFIGVAGIVMCSTLRLVSPTMGSDSMLGSISALMLGATFLRPGEFNIAGCVLGGVLLAIISNGLIMVNASFWTKDVVQAGILIISVGFVSYLGQGVKVKLL